MNANKFYFFAANKSFLLCILVYNNNTVCTTQIDSLTLSTLSNSYVRNHYCGWKKTIIS